MEKKICSKPPTSIRYPYPKFVPDFDPHRYPVSLLEKTLFADDSLIRNVDSPLPD
jgi:hypothetical protein